MSEESPLTFSGRKRRLSASLNRFLRTKRSSDVPPAPEMQDPSDEFLNEFHKHFPKVEGTQTTDPGGDESSSDDDGDALGNVRGTKEVNGANLTPSKPFSFEHPASADRVAEPTPQVVPLRLFNLPYKLDSKGEELTVWAKQHGVIFSNVVMEMKNGELSGAATVEAHLRPPPPPSGKKRVKLSLMGKGKDKDKYKDKDRGTGTGKDNSEDEEDDQNMTSEEKAERLRVKVIAKLQGEECRGRPVKVRDNSLSGRNRPSLGGGSRYYEKLENIHVKCNRCGQVGHLERECENKPLPMPCHLCAGTGHEAIDCPNIVCFRCRDFGHHRGDCRASQAEILRASRNRYTGGHNSGMGPDERTPMCTVCSQCGSLRHTFSYCPEIVAPHLYYQTIDRSKSKSSNDQSKKRKFNDQDEGAGKHCSSTGRISNVDRHPDIECMTCGELGHARCGSWPTITGESNDDSSQHENPRKKRKMGARASGSSSSSGVVSIYCPHCGEEGHHCDYPSRDGGFTCLPNVANNVERIHQTLISNQRHDRSVSVQSVRHHHPHSSSGSGSAPVRQPQNGGRFSQGRGRSFQPNTQHRQVHLGNHWRGRNR